MTDYPNLPDFGRRLQFIRVRRGLTRAALSASLGVNASTIARWESCEQNATDKRRTAAAAVLKCDPAETRWLLMGEVMP